MNRYLNKLFKYRSHSLILIYFILPLLALFSLTILNEAVDLPHYLFGDKATSFGQRKGELVLEGISFVTTLSLLFYSRMKLMKKIKILEGIIPICTHCKKIKMGPEWKNPDEYIASRSMADFSHGMCPECLKEKYPDIASEIFADKKGSIENENTNGNE